MTREQFFADCGLSSRPRLIVEGPAGEGPGTFELERPYLVIGRGERVDRRLDDPAVSGRHAYVQFLRGQPFVVDLGSRLGVRWGEVGRPAGWIEGPRGVQLGPYRVRVEGLDGPPEGVSRLDPMAVEATSRLPTAVLEFPGRRVGYPAWPMDRELTLIGRARDCKVRLAGSEISRYHCALVRTPGGVWAADLASRRGITVNGQPARWARLLPGDELVVGTQRIRLGLGPAASIESLPAPWSPLRTELTTVAETGPPQAMLVESLVEQLNRMQGQMFDHFQQSMVTVLQMFGAMHRDQLEVLRQELDELRRAVASGGSIPETGRASATASRPPDAAASTAVTVGATGIRPEPIERRPDPIERPEPADQVSHELHRMLARRVAALRDEQKGAWQKILAMMSGQSNGEAIP